MSTKSIDALIIGSGPCGSLVAKELAEQGASVLGLEAGIGVGGGTLAWLGVMPRFHPADFRPYSTEGVGAGAARGKARARRIVGGTRV